MTKEKKWIWMGHAAHFILGHECQFKLATEVGGFVVSTVGELKYPKLPGVIQKEEFEDLGWNRKYETMVFKSKKSNLLCCPYIMDLPAEIDFLPANDADTATKNHYKLCEKWSDHEK